MICTYIHTGSEIYKIGCNCMYVCTVGELGTRNEIQNGKWDNIQMLDTTRSGGIKTQSDIQNTQRERSGVG